MSTFALNILMLLVVAALWCFTLVAFLSMIKRRRELWGHTIDDQDMRMFMNQYARHEALRVTKHSIIVFMVAASTLRPQIFWSYFSDPMTARNVGVTIIGVLIGLNSMSDLVVRRRRLKAYARREELH